MRSVIGPLWKSVAFVLCTVLATGVLAATIRNSSSVEGTPYKAVFSDVTSLNEGDDVRMAGVRIGQVTDIEVSGAEEATVSLAVDPEVELSSSVTAAIRFRNLIGQRYISLDQGTGGAGPALAAGSKIGLDRTEPALDLTALFNGFRPLFRLLSPEDINKLSFQIIKVFQGEGSTVEGLISSTASLTQTLASRDEVIGDVVTNLNTLLTTMNGRTTELQTVISAMQSLVSGLSDDRAVLGGAVTSIGNLTNSLSGLVEQARPPLKADIKHLDTLSGNLAAEGKLIDRTLGNLPKKLDALARTASYGSWVNFYLCEVGGRIPVPEGYLGSVGATTNVSRCGA